MSDVGKKVWKAFKMLIEGFLGNHRRDNYVLVTPNVISVYEKLFVVSCMSLELHFYTLNSDF